MVVETSASENSGLWQGRRNLFRRLLIEVVPWWVLHACTRPCPAAFVLRRCLLPRQTSMALVHRFPPGRLMLCPPWSPAPQQHLRPHLFHSFKPLQLTVTASSLSLSLSSSLPPSLPLGYEQNTQRKLARKYIERSRAGVRTYVRYDYEV